jgi:hypothetical protein
MVAVRNTRVSNKNFAIFTSNKKLSEEIESLVQKNIKIMDELRSRADKTFFE